MWKIALSVLVAVAGAQAQVSGDRLPRHVAGVVVDSGGKPIAEARIAHTGDRQIHQTGTDGRFEIDTTAPAFVVWQPGYLGELVRTQETNVHITLQKESRAFPICSAASLYLGVDNGWAGLLGFPKVAGVATTPQEYVREGPPGAVIRYYYLETGPPTRPIQHSLGFGDLLPLDFQVWESVKYEEVTFTAGDRTIIDARGELRDGNRWRNIGVNNERVWYADADPVTAKRLDQILGGACLKSHPFR
jgi:hypothetical protein